MRIRFSFTIDLDRRPPVSNEPEQFEHRDGHSQAELAERHPIGFSPEFPREDRA